MAAFMVYYLYLFCLYILVLLISLTHKLIDFYGRIAIFDFKCIHTNVKSKVCLHTIYNIMYVKYNYVLRHIASGICE